MKCNGKEIYIYGLIDPETNIIRYVGKTVNIKRRLKTHITRSKNSNSHSAQWIKSLLKRGLKPKLTIIEIVDGDNWQDREMFWISKLKEINNLTNVTEGGDGGNTLGRLGKKNSPEHIAKCIKSRTGKKINQNDKNGMRRKGIIRHYKNNEKAILQYALEGRLINEWESAKKCEEETGFQLSNIIRSCKSKTRTANGFMWRYKVDGVIENIEHYLKPEHGSNKKIRQYTKNGELINEYNSITFAENKTKISKTAIANNLSGRSESAGGFIWEYVI